MRLLEAITVILVVAACGTETAVDPALQVGGGGSGGGGGQIAEPLHLPTCTTTATAPLDCGEAACAGETGHGLDFISKATFDRIGRPFVVGLRDAVWDSHGEVAGGSTYVSFFDGLGWRLLPILPDSFQVDSGFPIAFAAATPRAVWVSNYYGVAHWDGSAWSVAKFPSTVLSLAADPDEVAWAGDYTGLHHFDGTEWTRVANDPDNRGFWKPLTMRVVRNRVEIGTDFSFVVWENREFLKVPFLAHNTSVWPGADGWATASVSFYNGRILEERDGEWIVHRQGYDSPHSLAVWQGELLATRYTGLFHWTGGKLAPINGPPLTREWRLPKILSDGYQQLWVVDFDAATVWTLGSCWEAHGPKNLQPE